MKLKKEILSNKIKVFNAKFNSTVGYERYDGFKKYGSLVEVKSNKPKIKNNCAFVSGPIKLTKEQLNVVWNSNGLLPIDPSVEEKK